MFKKKKKKKEKRKKKKKKKKAGRPILFECRLSDRPICLAGLANRTRDWRCWWWQFSDRQSVTLSIAFLPDTSLGSTIWGSSLRVTLSQAFLPHTSLGPTIWGSSLRVTLSKASSPDTSLGSTIWGSSLRVTVSLVVVLVAFPWLERMFGDILTIRSPPALFFSFFLLSGDQLAHTNSTFF